MRKYFEKFKIPISVLLSAIFIIAVSATISAVHRGRETAVYSVKEEISEIEKDLNLSVYDVLSIEDIFLPERYKNVKAESLITATCRKYTEYEVITSSGSVKVRTYNYAYLTEDEPVIIPDNAKKIMQDDTEIFIFLNNDNTSTALYYQNLTRYIITENCSVQELEKIFN